MAHAPLRPILIHASNRVDSRPDGWSLVTPELSALAQLLGGIIGAGELSDCVRYNSVEAFSEATAAHRNAPDWFRPPGLFGFVFQNACPIAYHPCLGRTMFVAVEGITPS